MPRNPRHRPTSAGCACANTAAAALPPTRGWMTATKLPITIGKTANTPEANEPIQWLAVVTTATTTATPAARSGGSEGGRWVPWGGTRALRERGIGERKNRHGSIRGHAADGAGGDEGGRMLQRQDDVGCAGRGRQRGDQCGEEGPAAFGGNGRDDDNRRGHCRLEREPIPKERIGEHRASRRRIRRGRASPRSADRS